MLQAGPIVLGGGADLHLHRQLVLLVGKEHRHCYHQVQTTIAVGLGAGDVVLFADECDIILTQKRICQHVDIVDIRAYHPYAGHIIQIGPDGIQSEGQAPAFQLLNDAGGAFQPRVDEIDGVTPVTHVIFRIEHLELGADLFDGAGVHHHQFPVIHSGGHQLFCLLKARGCRPAPSTLQIGAGQGVLVGIGGVATDRLLLKVLAGVGETKIVPMHKLPLFCLGAFIIMRQF